MKKFIIAAAALIAALSFQSCNKDDGFDYNILYPNALVTIKPDGNSFYIQLDDSTVINVTNPEDFKFEEETRAFANFQFPARPWGPEFEAFANWIRPTLTKPTDETNGSGDADKEEFGEDPVELVKGWTVCEDGYLSLQFRAAWSRYGNVKHRVSLITGTDPEDPYLVVFRHDNCGDFPEVVADGYVSFRLSSLPDTKGETVKLKVKYLSTDGMKTVEFDYKTRPGDEVAAY
ncbi:MAG: NigD-like protein [Candidatus Cryptobacteroides sp.]